MIAPAPPYILVDTSYFIALFDRRDSYHVQALNKQEWLDNFSIIVPWPILYETMNTRFSRRIDQITRLDAVMKKPSTIWLEDSQYRAECYEKICKNRNRQRSGESLVDAIVLAILDDNNVKVDAILTFNDRDFRQFCRIRNIEYLCD